MKIFDKIKEIAFAFNPDLFPGRSLHLSFIVYKGRIISIGQNSKKTHPINLRNPKISKDGIDISRLRGTCSELSAVTRLKNLTNIPTNKCSLVNIRINKINEMRNSCPCNSCFSLLSYHSFRDIYFSNDKGEFEKFVL